MAVPYTVTSNANHADVERLTGWSFRESDASPAVATVRLRNNAVGGQVIAYIELPANGSQTVSLKHPVQVAGVYVEVVAGTVEGVLYQE